MKLARIGYPLAIVQLACVSYAKSSGTRPNILFVIADDQSFPHTSAYGSRMVSTPGFDLVASCGALFNNHYVTSPGSSPSRASILTGLYPWQLEEAGTHASYFPSKFTTFPQILMDEGYHVGYTGKGWDPGNWKDAGWRYNPAGPEYNIHKLDPPEKGISSNDYSANFRRFLDRRQVGEPFCFWLGTHEPHRPFRNGTEDAEKLKNIVVPGYLPDNDFVRNDLYDYMLEVEWLDYHLMNCIEELKKRGEFDHTIIIVTSDNGIAMPHAKANLYDAGIHVPLAICWGDKIKPGQIVDALTSGVDLAPTILAATGTIVPPMSGQSLLPLVGMPGEYASNAVFAGRERHGSARYANMGYPSRCVRHGDYLLIHNFRPERWPAGEPQEILKNGTVSVMHSAYNDIDGSPVKFFLIDNYTDLSVKPYFLAATQRRPEYELFNVVSSPDCMLNLANDKGHRKIFKSLRSLLSDKLVETNDPRIGDNPEIWEEYPRLVGPMREYYPR